MFDVSGFEAMERNGIRSTVDNDSEMMRSPMGYGEWAGERRLERFFNGVTTYEDVRARVQILMAVGRGGVRYAGWHGSERGHNVAQAGNVICGGVRNAVLRA